MEVHGYRIGNRAKIEIKGSAEEFAALMINLVGGRTGDSCADDAERAAARIRWLFQKHFSTSNGIQG